MQRYHNQRQLLGLGGVCVFSRGIPPSEKLQKTLSLYEDIAADRNRRGKPITMEIDTSDDAQKQIRLRCGG